MFTISDILIDIQRGITANNMVETCFSYRIVYYVNESGTGRKFHTDTLYGDLRRSLETIIRRNLTTTNTVVVAAVTTRKNGETVSLTSRPYGFNLNEYFRRICEESGKGFINNGYGRKRAQWC